ncbi:MAG TPA: glucose-1-phosphate thymidylyltransferase [Actinomycetota bacterium]|nr:glucose-1-phosphate thymidylyltransferase [Actinomycetota bacterium]
MRAVVLSGGEGSRLRPITHTQAKQLIPVGGTPILFHALEAIRDAGISEVGVVVGPPNEDEVRAAVGDGSRWGIRITFVRQEAPLGLAHAVLTAADFVGDEPFLLYLGDNVILEGVTRFVRGFERTRPDAQIFVARVPEPERFGVVELDGDRVVRLVEKPKEFVSDLALVGVYLFDPSILDACRSLEPSWRGEYEITEAIQGVVDRGGTVRVEMLQGWWKDTGKPDDLLEANRMLLSLAERSILGEVDEATTIEGAVVIEAGAKVTRSRLVGPVVIGPNAIVEDATIGPDVSLEAGCEVLGSVVRDSILMEGCRVVGVNALTGSLLGRNVDVEMRGDAAPRTHRLVVGDQSRLEVD